MIAETADMKQLTGRFPPENIQRMDVPRPPEGVLEVFQSHAGIVCLVSDSMDQLGLSGVLPGSRMRPMVPGRTIVGPALTIRKVPLRTGEGRRPRGDLEAHNLTSIGDVLVIEGGELVSNMGGLSARTGKRQGSLGAVIDGGCRDIDDMRAIDYPVWATSVTPITGVGRIDTEVINGDVLIGGYRVRCGDIIVANDDGVCIVPRERAVEVAEQVLAKVVREQERADFIDSGQPLWKMP